MHYVTNIIVFNKRIIIAIAIKNLYFLPRMHYVTHVAHTLCVTWVSYHLESSLSGFKSSQSNIRFLECKRFESTSCLLRAFNTSLNHSACMCARTCLEPLSISTVEHQFLRPFVLCSISAGLLWLNPRPDHFYKKHVKPIGSANKASLPAL